jgi:hypothetical protein
MTVKVKLIFGSSIRTYIHSKLRRLINTSHSVLTNVIILMEIFSNPSQTEKSQKHANSSKGIQTTQPGERVSWKEL